MGYALLILLVLAIVTIGWLRRNPQKVQAWMARRLQKHMAEQMRRQMEEAMRTAGARQQQAGERQNTRTGRQNERQSEPNPSGSRRGRRRRSHIIPPEYAEDIPFTEVRSYSSDTTVDAEVTDGASRTRVQVEEQVSDVEWTDILPDGKPGRRHTKR